jgi:hypothetical protein
VHKMNDMTRHQNVTGQLNRQTADRTANAYVFLFFPTAHFLKTVLASRTNGTFAFAPTHKTDPSAKAKEPFFANAQQTV